MTNTKSVAVLGGGIAGLYAAWRLQKLGYDVTLLEKNDQLGGLASTFKIGNGNLEKFYHHFFQTDSRAIDLIKELNLSDDFYFKQLKTAIYWQGQTYLLNGPLDLLKFKPLPWLSRFRVGAVLLFLKKTKRWRRLEGIAADRWLKKWLGKKAYAILWQPLLQAKFGQYYQEVNMAWFWSRIHCRSAKLGYFKKGYITLINKLIKEIKNLGVKIELQADVRSIELDLTEDRLIVKTTNSRDQYDLVVSTLPETILPKIISNLDQKFIDRYLNHSHLGAQTLILILKKPLLEYYWLNINDPKFPFLVVVDQSKIADINNYSQQYPVYFGNYLSDTDPRWQKTPDELLEMYLPYIKKINPDFSLDWVNKKYLFQAGAAQYVVKKNHSQTVLPIKLPLRHYYSAAMAQVYPQDRGVNYALVLVDQVILQIQADYYKKK